MIRTTLITLLCCAAFGLLRMPLESHVFRQEYDQKLLPAPLTARTQNEMGQQVTFFCLGGLRSLVASMMCVDAISFFQQREWGLLEKRYDQIVLLAPHNPFYWKNGALHIGIDAAVDTRDNKNLTASQRLIGYKNYLRKGRLFLERGIQANPDNWFLYVAKGQMMSNIYHHPDFAEAAAAYHKANELGAPEINQRMEFYSLVRVPGKSLEAWQMGRKLYANKNNRLTSLVVSLFALENKLHIPESKRIPFDELFPSDQSAIRELEMQLTNGLGYPVDGVEEKLKELRSKNPLTKKPY